MSNKKQKDEYDLKAYREDVSAHLIAEIFSIIQNEGKKHGDEHAHELSMALIRNITASLVNASLQNPNVPSNMSPDEARVLSFRHMKTDVQNAVADGFTGAVVKNTGESLEYYCEVKLVPEPKNKEMI